MLSASLRFVPDLRKHATSAWLLAALILAGCGADGKTSSTVVASPPGVPNVVMIVVDTLRPDRLGAWGQVRDTSPHIDELASQSIRFSRATSQAPWTTPSTASLLTSLYPHELGIETEPNKVPDQAILLPELLRDKGYQTFGVVAGSFLSRRWNFDQGFSRFEDENVSGLMSITSPEVTRAAIKMLKSRDRSRPFFLFVHYYDPHFHYTSHADFNFTDAEEEVRSGEAEAGQGDLGRKVETAGPESGQLFDSYDSEVGFTDHYIGRLLQFLRDQDLFDDSLIVFTADHGEEFLDHGGWKHAHSLYEEVIHVPLLFKLPQSRTGRVEDRQVGLIDVFPTITEILGVDVEHPISGASLFSAAEVRPVFSETSRNNNLQAVIYKGHKAIVDLNDDDKWRLYDLSTDPAEKHDLAGERVELLDELKEEIRRWRENTRAAVEADSVVLDAEQTEQLKALGYLE